MQQADHEEHARLVVIAPAAAEILEELGLTDDVVGVGDYIDRPPALLALPRVGDYNQPSIEAVLELQADILITTTSKAAQASNRHFRQLGVEVVELDTSTMDVVRESILLLGNRLARHESAERLVREFDNAMQEIRTAAQGARPRSVLFVVGRDPLYAAGPGSHIDGMIAATGGINLLQAGAPYQMVSLEAVLEKMPDVIIDTSDNSPHALRGIEPGTWGTWDFLPAVRKNRVFWVDPDLLVIPGMRLPGMTRRVGRMIHPEIFGAPGEFDFRPDRSMERPLEDSP